MALSRFWSFIIVCSILYIFYLLVTGRTYTIGNIVNGSQNDPIIIKESDGQFQFMDSALYYSLKSGNGVVIRGDTTIRLTEKGVLEVTAGKLPADGIFMTCKNTIMDIWLPLIGYLTFFCGLL